MKTKLLKMLEMQAQANAKIDPNWKDNDHNYLRAAWVECGELMEHIGYKWWKKQTPDWNQAKMEVVDILHFILSDTLMCYDLEDIDFIYSLYTNMRCCNCLSPIDLNVIDITTLPVKSTCDSCNVTTEIQNGTPSTVKDLDFIRELIDDLVKALSYNTSHELIFMMLSNCIMPFDELYKLYMGKNVLNIFRQEHGYKEGTYKKIWGDKEDNEYLKEIVDKLDVNADNFCESIYRGLFQHYALIR